MFIKVETFSLKMSIQSYLKDFKRLKKYEHCIDKEYYMAYIMSGVYYHPVACFC